MATSGRPGTYITENFEPLQSSGGIPGEALPAIASIHPRGPVGPTKVTSWNQFTNLYGSFSDTPGSILPFAVSQFFNNGGSTLYVLRLANTDAVAAALTLEDINSPDPDDALVVTANSPGVWGENIFVEYQVSQASRGNFNVYLVPTGGTAGAGNLVETFPDVTMNPSDSRYLPVIINSPSAGSQYVKVKDLISNEIPIGAGSSDAGYSAGETDLAPLSPAPLTSASDGTTAPNLATAIPIAFDTLPDQALVINVPGLANINTINTLLAWCGTDTDKMLVIDSRPSTDPVPDINALPGTNYNAQVTSDLLAMVKTGGTTISASTYAAVYAPWILTSDPSSQVPGAVRWLPPGGAVLGQYNATDVSRGVFVTPAGTKNPINVVALETQFTNPQLDQLNDAGVNALKPIPGIGYCIFGGRTLHPGYPDRYIAVRRQVIKLEHDFTYLMRQYLFEPNDPTLWRQISAVLTNYLTQQLQVGALGGSTPADSFKVVCDDTNNQPQTAQAGIVNVDVAVALLSPAEFINITLSQMQNTGTTTVTTTT